jgi:hypothetical protein
MLDGEVTRRIFVGSLAGACLGGEHVILEAIAAERMPHRIIVSGVKRAPFFELRDYGTAEVGSILNRLGIPSVYSENGKYLFAFESLAARERTWREVRLDGASLREITVYRSL